MDVDVVDGSSGSKLNYLSDKAPDYNSRCSFKDASARPKKRSISVEEKSTFVYPNEGRALIMGLSPEIDEVLSMGYPSYMLYIVENSAPTQGALNSSLFTAFPKYYGNVEHAIFHADGKFSYVHLDYLGAFKPVETVRAITNLSSKVCDRVRLRVTFDTQNRGRLGKKHRYDVYTSYCRSIFNNIFGVSGVTSTLEAIILNHSTEPAVCALLTVLDKLPDYCVESMKIINYRDTYRMQTAWFDLVKSTDHDPIQSAILMLQELHSLSKAEFYEPRIH